VVRRREARPGPDLAQAAPSLGTDLRASAGRFTAPERNAIWAHAAQTASDAAAQIRSLAASSPDAAADAAWATADTLHAAAAAVGSRVLHQAADSYDRAARAPYGRIPQPTPTGDSLRRAARLLAKAALATEDSTSALVMLIIRPASALAEAVAELRSGQRHAAQAAAARLAAEQLSAAHGHTTLLHREPLRARPATAAQQARLDNPVQLFPRVPRRLGQSSRPARLRAHHARRAGRLTDHAAWSSADRVPAKDFDGQDMVHDDDSLGLVADARPARRSYGSRPAS
jgi:hypothetical protein